jgi:hypothetical protein
MLTASAICRLGNLAIEPVRDGTGFLRGFLRVPASARVVPSLWSDLGDERCWEMICAKCGATTLRSLFDNGIRLTKVQPATKCANFGVASANERLVPAAMA